ncbi:MAG: type III-A CRISPR-associated protein Csm2, partial [Tissierellia bacterium]|nr:type III-A CRISPR-associated protein Csm2 [Tissierellia bacterium]
MEINNNNFVDKAEKVISKINSDRRMITTSKIRNILSMASIIYENAKRGKGNLREEELADIQMLRMKLIYDSGRDRDVKNFVNGSGLL